jgi:hypothetical protein
LKMLRTRRVGLGTESPEEQLERIAKPAAVRMFAIRATHCRPRTMRTTTRVEVP